MSFSQVAILVSIFFGGLFFLLLFISVRHPRFVLGLPRSRNLGLPLALICLIWSAREVALMLEGNMARFQNSLWILVPLGAVLAYFFLSYLFTRALGGVLLLMVSWLLHAAFGVGLPGRPLFSFFAYLTAAAGAVLIAQPWLFRELLQRSIDFSRFRQAAASMVAVPAMVFLVFALLG